MNSPTEKPQKSKQTATANFNPEVLVLVKVKLMLAKTVWWLLRNPSAIVDGVALVDDEGISPLWNLTPKEVDGKLHFTADLLPDLTDNQISNVVEFLLGTKNTLPDAIEKFTLPQAPDYIEASIRQYVVRHDGTWMHPDQAGAQKI